MKTATKNDSSVPHAFKNPRLLLQAELARRSRKNPRYSLRAFARSVGISHTVLSLVLSGKRPLSRKATLKLADFLDLNPEQRDALLSTHRSSSGNSGKVETDSVYQRISMDTFEVISEWYHYAILSVLELPDARFEARWLSRHLGITILEAKLAKERLERLGLVTRDEDGKWRQSGKPLRIENRRSTEATRRFHKQLLNKAIESLENDPIESRDFSSMTLAIDPCLVGYARQRIREFRRELAQALESQSSPKEVYNLTVQLFPVTHKTRKETQS